MLSALFVAFAFQLAIFLINAIDKQVLTDTLWLLYTKLPSAHAGEARSLSDQRKEVVRLNREMNATSAQDEFAKWAKLRRQHDKAKEKYDERARAFSSTQTNFSRLITALRFLGTQTMQFGCNMYYAKEAMFWLPQGWVPYHVEWLLSCPRAPLGSISVNVWAIACASVIGLVSEGVMALWTLQAGVVKDGPRKGEKVVLDSPVRKEGIKMGVGSGGGGFREKKEL